MGQKVNPIGYRTGITTEWNTCWFDRDGKYPELVLTSVKLRHFLTKFYPVKCIINIKIEHNFGVFIIYLTCQDIGSVIGEKGSKINEITEKLKEKCNCDVQIVVEKEKQNTVSASALALSVIHQMSQRYTYKKAIRSIISTAEAVKIPGIKVNISGRLGGAEIARAERVGFGRIPAHTLRANIDYACRDILTKYGVLGLKVWLYKGDMYELPESFLGVHKKSTTNKGSGGNRRG